MRGSPNRVAGQPIRGPATHHASSNRPSCPRVAVASADCAASVARVHQGHWKARPAARLPADLLRPARSTTVDVGRTIVQKLDVARDVSARSGPAVRRFADRVDPRRTTPPPIVDFRAVSVPHKPAVRDRSLRRAGGRRGFDMATRHTGGFPRRGRNRPARQRISVVFPVPLAPSTATISPTTTCRFTSSKTMCSPRATTRS